jgi:predicted DNA-binding protein
LKEIKNQPIGGYIMEATNDENKTVIFVPIDTEVKDKFKALCKEEGRTMAGKIRDMIKKYLKRQ